MRKNKDKNIKANDQFEQNLSGGKNVCDENSILTDAAETASLDTYLSVTGDEHLKPSAPDSHARVYVDNEGGFLEQDEDHDAQKESEERSAEDVIVVEDGYDVENDDEEDIDDNKIDDDGRLDLVKIFKILTKYWWMIALNCLIVGIVAALLIVEEPRTYQSSVALAPESSGAAPTGGSLSSLASSFGIDIGSASSSDAIRPDLYPDLVASSDFILDLFKIPVKTLDGNVFTDYYTYMKKYQRSSWWRKDLQAFMKKFKDKPKDPKAIAGANALTEPEQTKSGVMLLSYEEQSIVDAIKASINCSVDKQTYTVTISVVDQDPLICATVADTVRSKIQTFITDYRTKKATKDYNYYYKLLVQAKEEYEKACAAYAKYVDSHRDIILQAYISERDQLENNMQLKLNTYNAMLTQAQNAKAKIQENTPAFTVLQNAVVPVKPSGPKRMLFVIGFVFMTFVVSAIFIVFRN